MHARIHVCAYVCACVHLCLCWQGLLHGDAAERLHEALEWQVGGLVPYVYVHVHVHVYMRCGRAPPWKPSNGRWVASYLMCMCMCMCMCICDAAERLHGSPRMAGGWPRTLCVCACMCMYACACACMCMCWGWALVLSSERLVINHHRARPAEASQAISLREVDVHHLEWGAHM